jgi:aconitase A
MGLHGCGVLGDRTNHRFLGWSNKDEVPNATIRFAEEGLSVDDKPTIPNMTESGASVCVFPIDETLE